MSRGWIAACLTGLALLIGAPRAPAADTAPPSRCDAAQRLAAAGRTELSDKQVLQAVNDPTTRECALAVIENTPKTPAAITRCAIAEKLIKAGLLDDAQGQAEKALDDDATRACAVGTLTAVKDAKDAKADDDKTTTVSDAFSAIDDALRKAWPWLAVLAIAWLLGLIARLFFPSKRVAISASKTDQPFAEMIVQAATAAGDDGRPPAKILNAGNEQLPDGTVTDLVKLLGLPSKAPITSLLNLAIWPLRPNQLRVTLSAAGGWAVVQVDLRRLWHLRRSERLAIPTPSPYNTDEHRKETLALIAGAWLAGILQAKDDNSPAVWQGDFDAVTAHAYYRAGANLHERGNLPMALVCYAAMPPAIDATRAPFAWVGARLNLMAALQIQGRYGEARAIAATATAAIGCLLATQEIVTWFGDGQLHDLKRRAAYMIATLYQDEVTARRGDPILDGSPEPPGAEIEAANTALQAAIDEPDAATAQPGLIAAMRMVAFCHKIQKTPPAPVGCNDVKDVLNNAMTAADGTVRPALSAAAFYDAACVLCLIADGDAAGGANDLAYALAYLQLAAAATPANSLPRVQLTAKADSMLKPLHAPAYAAALREALRIADPPPEPDLRLAVTTTAA